MKLAVVKWVLKFHTSFYGVTEDPHDSRSGCDAV